MASTTPGGNAWDPEGRPPDQATAQMRDARDRELMEGAQTVVDTALASFQAMPPGGLAGDFLTRTASGYRWTPPLVDSAGTVVDLSGLYFIDNGDGTVTPAHPSSYTDGGTTITMNGA